MNWQKAFPRRHSQVVEMSTILGYPSSMIKKSKSIYSGYRFPVSLRIEDLLAARGIIVSHESVRRWAEIFGRNCANKIRRRGPSVRRQVAFGRSP